MSKGRYIDTGQYDHHVWVYRTYMELVSDLICYGSSYYVVTLDGIERIPPQDVMIKHV